MNKKIKVAGYTKKVNYSDGISYRPFAPLNDSLENGNVFYSGNFTVDVNSDKYFKKDYSTKNFSKYYTEETIEELRPEFTKLKLNPSTLKNYAYFGSLKERFRVALENIIIKFPASLTIMPYYFINGDLNLSESIITVTNDKINNTTNITLNELVLNNPFNVKYKPNQKTDYNNDLRNLNNNIHKYTLKVGTSIKEHQITSVSYNNDLLTITFDGIVTKDEFAKNIVYVSPNNIEVDKFYNDLDILENQLLNRKSNPKYTYSFIIKELGSNGKFSERVKKGTWLTSDGYNISFDDGEYINFVTDLIALCEHADSETSNIMIRELVPTSLLEFDTVSSDVNEDNFDSSQKIKSLLSIYGRSFDNVKQYIDGISFANVVTYDGFDNTPDIYLRDLAKNLGWEVTDNNSIVSHITKMLLGDVLTGLDYTNEEIENEVLRRLIINSPYIFKTKGTRASVDFINRFLGIPDKIINFNEHVYVANNKIDSDDLSSILFELKSSDLIYDLPIDDDGYPRPLKNTEDNYFQGNGRWFRTTGGSETNNITNQGNNPHMGNYDGGRKYIEQFNNLIPNFKSVDIVKHTSDIGLTNKFTSYDNGTFEEESGKNITNVAQTTAIIDKKFPIKTGIDACGCEYTDAGNELRINTNLIDEKFSCDYDSVRMDEKGILSFYKGATQVKTTPECCMLVNGNYVFNYTMNTNICTYEDVIDCARFVEDKTVDTRYVLFTDKQTNNKTNIIPFQECCPLETKAVPFEDGYRCDKGDKENNVMVDVKNLTFRLIGGDVNSKIPLTSDLSTFDYFLNDIRVFDQITSKRVSICLSGKTSNWINSRFETGVYINKDKGIEINYLSFSELITKEEILKQLPEQIKISELKNVMVKITLKSNSNISLNLRFDLFERFTPNTSYNNLRISFDDILINDNKEYTNKVIGYPSNMNAFCFYKTNKTNYPSILVPTIDISEKPKQRVIDLLNINSDTVNQSVLLYEVLTDFGIGNGKTKSFTINNIKYTIKYSISNFTNPYKEYRLMQVNNNVEDFNIRGINNTYNEKWFEHYKLKSGDAYINSPSDYEACPTNMSYGKGVLNYHKDFTVDANGTAKAISGYELMCIKNNYGATNYLKLNIQSVNRNNYNGSLSTTIKGVKYNLKELDYNKLKNVFILAKGETIHLTNVKSVNKSNYKLNSGTLTISYNDIVNTTTKESLVVYFNTDNDLYRCVRIVFGTIIPRSQSNDFIINHNQLKTLKNDLHALITDNLSSNGNDYEIDTITQNKLNITHRNNDVIFADQDLFVGGGSTITLSNLNKGEYFEISPISSYNSSIGIGSFSNGVVKITYDDVIKFNNTESIIDLKMIKGKYNIILSNSINGRKLTNNIQATTNNIKLLNNAIDVKAKFKNYNVGKYKPFNIYIHDKTSNIYKTNKHDVNLIKGNNTVSTINNSHHTSSQSTIGNCLDVDSVLIGDMPIVFKNNNLFNVIGGSNEIINYADTFKLIRVNTFRFLNELNIGQNKINDDNDNMYVSLKIGNTSLQNRLKPYIVSANIFSSPYMIPYADNKYMDASKEDNLNYITNVNTYDELLSKKGSIITIDRRVVDYSSTNRFFLVSFIEFSSNFNDYVVLEIPSPYNGGTSLLVKGICNVSDGDLLISGKENYLNNGFTIDLNNTINNINCSDKTDTIPRDLTDTMSISPTINNKEIKEGTIISFSNYMPKLTPNTKYFISTYSDTWRFNEKYNKEITNYIITIKEEQGGYSEDYVSYVINTIDKC